VPLGAFLSGGIDSSCVVGLMRELGAEPLRTFSIGFADQTYNELAHARRIAERFHTEHEELILEPKALELTEKLVRHLDEPLGDFSIFPTYLVSEMARRRVTVALSGDGGDELFAGYEHFQAQRLARWPGMAPAARAAGIVVGGMRPSRKKKGAWNKLRRFTRAFDHDPGHRHLRWMMFLTDAVKRDLYGPAFQTALGGILPVRKREPFAGHFAAMNGFDALTGELYLDLKTYLVDDIMVKVDRMSMATSLEAREPLLDHKLAEFAFRLPGDLKLHGSTTKWIFKKTLERLLPHEILYRKKEGFSIPIKHWLAVELRDLLEGTLSEKRVREGGWFEYAPIRRMIDAHAAGRENFSHELWALLVFETWRDNYL
jgi:asparagine synthase (glutamine-hydrolysing)